MKITISNCWSYYNKGDAAITTATLKLVKDALPGAEISILAFEPKTFQENYDPLYDSVRILPMPTVKDSLTPIQRIFSAISLFQVGKASRAFVPFI